MSIDTRAPQVTTSQLMDWLKTTYAVPHGGSYPPTPSDKEFFFNDTLQIYAQYDQSIPGWVNLGPGTGFEKGNLPTGTNTLELYDTKSQAFAYLFLIYDPDNSPAPLLMTDQGFVVKKDLAVGGNILSGQGAFILSHGWTGSGTPAAYSPPLIKLLKSTTSIQSGWSFPTGMNSQPGALFNRTDQGILYIWSGSSWIASETSFSGYYDTLYLKMKDGTTPANLNLGKLEIQSTNNKFAVTAGDNGANQDTYLIPQNPSGQGAGLGLGTAIFPFKWVDASNVFCNVLNKLEGTDAVGICLSPFPQQKSDYSN
jgi:hypothetical protein